MEGLSRRRIKKKGEREKKWRPLNSHGECRFPPARPHQVHRCVSRVRSTSRSFGTHLSQRGLWRTECRLEQEAVCRRRRRPMLSPTARGEREDESATTSLRRGGGRTAKIGVFRDGHHMNMHLHLLSPLLPPLRVLPVAYRTQECRGQAGVARARQHARGRM